MDTRVPIWLYKAFERITEQLEEIDRVLVLSIQGISGLRGAPGLVEALIEWKSGEDDVPGEEELRRAQKTAEMSRIEVERGFPLLHAHAVISLWNTVEALIEDFLVEWLLNNPSELKGEAFSKLKVPLAEFESLEKPDRVRLLIQEMGRTNGAAYKQGVDRFEWLLNPLGLSGPVAEDAKRNILELQNVRNVIVHRASVADRRLVQSCPWMGIKVGDTVRVRHEDYLRYANAIGFYVLVIMRRIGPRFGVKLSAEDTHGS